jgi:hypothetical protein
MMLIKSERSEIGETMRGEIGLRFKARATTGIDFPSFESLSLSNPEKIGLQRAR